MTSRLDYAAVSPAGDKALRQVYGYVAQSGLDGALVELVYLRTSQVNGCAYCIDMHSRDLLKRGMSVDKLVLVQVWREAGDLFDATERAGLAWAEAVTRIGGGVPDDVYVAVSAVLSDKEIVDLTIAIGLMNAFNRLGISFRTVPAGAETSD